MTIRTCRNRKVVVIKEIENSNVVLGHYENVDIEMNFIVLSKNILIPYKRCLDTREQYVEVLDDMNWPIKINIYNLSGFKIKRYIVDNRVVEKGNLNDLFHVGGGYDKLKAMEEEN